jgi:hypothetical protein
MGMKEGGGCGRRLRERPRNVSRGERGEEIGEGKRERGEGRGEREGTGERERGEGRGEREEGRELGRGKIEGGRKTTWVQICGVS